MAEGVARSEDVSDLRAGPDLDDFKGIEAAKSEGPVEVPEFLDVRPCDIGKDLVAAIVPTDLLIVGKELPEGVDVRGEPVVTDRAKHLQGARLIVNVHAAGLEQIELLLESQMWFAVLHEVPPCKRKPTLATEVVEGPVFMPPP